MSRRKIETTCRVPHKRWYSLPKDALDEAKRQAEESGIEIFAYYCRWTPCAYMHTIHLTKNPPREPRDVKLNAGLVKYYEDRGNKGKGSKEAKRKRHSAWRRRKFYRDVRLPNECWENEGGSFFALHED